MRGSSGGETLDPGADANRVQETADILNALRTLRFPMASREEFVATLEERGLERSIAMWLAMNLRRTADGMRDFPVDIDAVEQLLESYYATDTWAAVERPRERTQVHLIVGGRSRVLNPHDRARTRRATREHDNVHVHVLPDAGHWVHVDEPEALIALLTQVSALRGA